MDKVIRILQHKNYKKILNISVVTLFVMMILTGIFMGAPAGIQEYNKLSVEEQKVYLQIIGEMIFACYLITFGFLGCILLVVRPKITNKLIVSLGIVILFSPFIMLGTDYFFAHFGSLGKFLLISLLPIGFIGHKLHDIRYLPSNGEQDKEKSE